MIGGEIMSIEKFSGLVEGVSRVVNFDHRISGPGSEDDSKKTLDDIIHEVDEKGNDGGWEKVGDEWHQTNEGTYGPEGK